MKNSFIYLLFENIIAYLVFGLVYVFLIIPSSLYYKITGKDSLKLKNKGKSSFYDAFDHTYNRLDLTKMK